MNNSKEYWESRSTKAEILMQKKTDETVKAVNEVFESATKSVNERVSAVFDRYANGNNLSTEEATKLLNEKQTAEFRTELMQMLEKETDKEARKRIIAVLDAPAYAYRISLLEALANEIYAEAVTVGAFENRELEKRLVDIYSQSYYRRTFDIQQSTGEYYNFEKLSSRRLKQAVSQEWNGSNYSKRVWKNTDETASKLREIVIKGIMTGQSSNTMSEALTHTLGIDSDHGARFKASRLIRTEVNNIAGQGTQKAYIEANIEKYVYLATLDKRTCHDCGSADRKSCAELDGEIFPVSEAKVGVNKHPMHPFCRCSDYPYIEGRTRKRQRSARDPKTGKSIRVPADMTYSQWYAKYVDNEGESGIIGVVDKLERRKENIGIYSNLEIPLQKRYVLNVCKKYGIETQGINFKIQRSEEFLNTPFYGSTDYDNLGRIDLFPNAFLNEEQLVRTVLHERCHYKQLQKFGKDYVQNNLNRMESVAYRYEDIYYPILKKRVDKNEVD